MTTITPDVLPSIRTLPLSAEAQGLFSRAVRIVQQRPGDFSPVAGWMEQHYAEPALRKLCERQYRQGFRYRLWLLRRDSATYNRRLAIQKGIPLRKLMCARIREARFRGQRLEGNCIASRQPDFIGPRGAPVRASNVNRVWRWEDERYRQQFRQIKAERGAAKLSEHDHPESPGWRLRRAVGELVEAEYPDGAEHVEHSRRIVALAALLMPEPLPMLGEFWAWPFASTLDLPATPTGDWLTDELAGDAARAAQGPHGYQPTLLDLRKVGREEVLFVRMPGESRQVQHDFPLNDLLKLLAVAVDDVDAATTEPDLSDVLQRLDDEHGLPLPELARQLAALAGDVEAASYVPDPLRHNAADLSQAARLQFRNASMERREVEPGRWQWIKRDTRNRPLDERRLEHHLCQALAVLGDLRDGRKAADTPTKLRAIAKGIEQTAPKPANIEPQAQADPPAMPAVPAAGNPAKALSKEAKALAALADHPDWTDEQIAQAAGCDRRSLYRMKKFVAAKGVLKDGNGLLPRGSKDKLTGGVEAWDERDDDE